MHLHGPRPSVALASAVVAAALSVSLATLLHAQVAVCYAEWCITDQRGVERCVVNQIPLSLMTWTAEIARACAPGGHAWPRCAESVDLEEGVEKLYFEIEDAVDFLRERTLVI